jgi:hypothetical protein
MLVYNQYDLPSFNLIKTFVCKVNSSYTPNHILITSSHNHPKQMKFLILETETLSDNIAIVCGGYLVSTCEKFHT